MEKIFCLTCNDRPIAVSEEREKLVNLMEESKKLILNSDEFEVLFVKDNTIEYHDGISYLTNRYEIIEIEKL